MLASINSMPCDALPAFSWPRPGHRNFSTTFPSRKNRKSVRCVTRLHADYCVHLEHDSRIERYWAQPHVFSWMSGTSKYRYAPHFLVANGDGSGCYCEVLASFAGINASRGETLLEFEALCGERGWRFHRIEAATIHNKEFDTLHKLYLRSLDATTDEYTKCLKLLPQLVWPATIREVLLTVSAFALPALCRCLFFGQLKADLSQALDLDLMIQGPVTSEAHN